MIKRDKYNIDYLVKLSETIGYIDRTPIKKYIEILIRTLNRGKSIYIFGNGGSATTASHITCDLNKTASYGFSKRFRAICLNDNIATIMAYANDFEEGFDSVFKELLKNFLKKGDIAIGISGSGNSENIVRAISYAKEQGNFTIGFCGFDGGWLKKNADLVIYIPINDMQITEDLHLAINHMAIQSLTKYYGEH